MTKTKIPLVYSILISVLVGFAVFFWYKMVNGKPDSENAELAENAPNPGNYHIIRKQGFIYTRPVLLAKESEESQNLGSLKSDLNSLISTLKTSNQIAGISVYLRLLDNGDWISAGDVEKYVPGSLMKVPELITFLKMNEAQPGLLNQKISYSVPIKLPKQSLYLSKSIEVGKTYSIRELLYYMIAYSDNYATALLNERMDVKIFKQVFTDLGIPEPDLSKNDILITANQYSRFMRVLYNGTYLSNHDSEYCLELLSNSDYKNGILSGLPKNIKVSHKFGEAGDGTYAYLSESAIVYLNNTPYLLSVMARSKNSQSLPASIAQLSKAVFENLRGRT